VNALTPVAAAEWLKLRSVRSTWWFAGGAVILMLLVALSEANGTASDLRADGGAPGSVEAASPAMAAVAWLHLALGAFGILAMTSEYATQSITATLACTPARTRLLLAKTAVVGGAVFVAGLVLTALGVAAGAPLLGKYADFDAGQIAERILASGVDLALVAALALGLGTLIRRSAGALVVLFVLLTLIPNVLQELARVLHAGYLATAADFTPAPAGQRFMTGEPAYGLVLAAWAAGAVAAGGWALLKRDA
jgi:ABC-2 type transport system permease protein